MLSRIFFEIFFLLSTVLSVDTLDNTRSMMKLHQILSAWNKWLVSNTSTERVGVDLNQWFSSPILHALTPAESVMKAWRLVKPGRHPVHLVLPQDTHCQPDQKHRSSLLRCWNYQVDQGVTALPEKWNTKNISM